MVLLFVSAPVVVAAFAVAPTAIQNRIAYGTFSISGPPPRVDFCGRRYYPAEPVTTETGAEVAGATQVATAPSGLPIVARLLSAGEKSAFHTDVCTMEVWVQTGANSYVPYSLSGGP